MQAPCAPAAPDLSGQQLYPEDTTYRLRLQQRALARPAGELNSRSRQLHFEAARKLAARLIEAAA